MSPAKSAFILRLAGKAAVWAGFAGLCAWGTLAVFYSGGRNTERPLAAGLFCAAALAAATLPRGRAARAGCTALVFAPLFAWWFSLKPSNDRDWTPDTAAITRAEIWAGSVTVRGIRHCDYRTETDYTVRRYDASFGLDGPLTLDAFTSEWGAAHIAHTMLSFGFGNGRYLCFSIETRREKGEEYSALRGFFRQYEIVYVAADERDVVRLRTNFRLKEPEEVRLYRIKAKPHVIRLILLDYLKTMNSLAEKPRWYNALTTNCTTSIWRHSFRYYSPLRPDWRILASGHAVEMLYDMDLIDRSMPLEELKRLSRINERSLAAGNGADYSEKMRKGLPGF